MQRSGRSLSFAAIFACNHPRYITPRTTRPNKLGHLQSVSRLSNISNISNISSVISTQCTAAAEDGELSSSSLQHPPFSTLVSHACCLCIIHRIFICKYLHKRTEIGKTVVFHTASLINYLRRSCYFVAFCVFFSFYAEITRNIKMFNIYCINWFRKN